MDRHEIFRAKPSVSRSVSWSISRPLSRRPGRCAIRTTNRASFRITGHGRGWPGSTTRLGR